MAMRLLASGLKVNMKMLDGETPGEVASLLERIAASRDKAALASLFGLYGPRVKSMLMKQGADMALAEDLVQDTFVSVWRKAGLYSRDRGAVSTWIFTIARNLRIDQVRRQSNKPYEDLDGLQLASDAQPGSQYVEQQQVIQRVTGALETLPAEQREVVRLSFIQNLAHPEIAKRLGIPLGTVKSRLRLAYDRLRPQLEDLH
jgi:RNA polymerase sigma-70 factor (ECF subfamily)